MAKFTKADFEPEIERVEEAFEYESDAGTTYTLADPKALKPDVLFELDQHGAEHMLYTLLGENEDTYNALMAEPEIDGYLLDVIMRRWRKHYGLDVTPGNLRGLRKPSTRSGQR